MADIREILAALDTDDKARFLEARNTMRRAFMGAHAASSLGIDKWTQEDDAFLDLIDVKLAMLFDRSGHMDTKGKDIIHKEDGARVEDSIIKQSEASKKLTNFSGPKNTGWGNA